MYKLEIVGSIAERERALSEELGRKVSRGFRYSGISQATATP